jgi:uncharacterized protein (TIGR02246 family)
MNQNYETDLRGIEELRRRDIAASKSQDAEGLAALWTEDGVALPPGQAPTVGKRAISASIARMVEASSGEFEILDYQEKFEETKIVGDHAFEWGFISGSERRRSDGQVLRSTVKVLRILQRQPDGSWRIRISMFNEAKR